MYVRTKCLKISSKFNDDMNTASKMGSAQTHTQTHQNQPKQSRRGHTTHGILRGSSTDVSVETWEARRQNADTVKVLKEKTSTKNPLSGKTPLLGRNQNPGSQRLGKGHDVAFCSVRFAEGRVLEKAGGLEPWLLLHRRLVRFPADTSATATPLEDLVPSSGLCGYHTCVQVCRHAQCNTQSSTMGRN